MDQVSELDLRDVQGQKQIAREPRGTEAEVRDTDRYER